MAGIFSGIHRALFYQPAVPTKKNELRSRWLIVLFLCVGLFGSYYVYDIPAATESALSNAFEGAVSNSSSDGCINGTATNTASDDDAASFNNNFNLLYSVYSWPNVLLPFFGGYISDRLGVRLMGVVFMSLMAIGQLVVALGASYISVNPNTAWYIMWTGRTVFGFGGESLSVVQSALIASFFQGKELAFALGVNLALARIGSVMNNLVSAVIASNLPVAWAYWAGFFVLIIAVASMIYVYYLDLAAENLLRANTGKSVRVGQGLFPQLWAMLTCRMRSHASYEAVGGEDAVVAGDEDAAAAPVEEIHMSAVLKFPFVFWVLTASCLTVYIDVLTFNNNCADFVTQKYLATKPTWLMCDADRASIYLTANSIMSTTYLVAGMLTPFFGTAVDLIGLRAALNMVAAGAIMSVHLVLGLTTFYPVVPLVALGLCYSIYASALWPSIALVIVPEYQATAYGVVTAIQNMGQAVSPLVVALLMPDPHCKTKDECDAGWGSTEMFFVYMGAVGVGCGVLLNVVDHCVSRYPVLNCTEATINRMKRAAGELPADKDGEGGDGLVVNSSQQVQVTTPLLESGPGASNPFQTPIYSSPNTRSTLRHRDAEAAAAGSSSAGARRLSA